MKDRKKREEYATLTAALADGEIQDDALRAEVELLISTDPYIRAEYIVQKSVKSAVKQKCTYHSCGSELKKCILEEIKSFCSKNRSDIENLLYRCRTGVVGRLFRRKLNAIKRVFN